MPNLTRELLEKFIEQGESSIVDFKAKNYFDKTSIADKDKTAEFVKDVLCMANTIRTFPAYILIGIKDENGTRIPVGLLDNELIDDSILQQKIKNKIYPVPKFYSYVFHYLGKKLSVIEIPVSWYESIPLPTVSQKGLEASRVYIRRNSSNEVAYPNEILELNHWRQSLSSLPSPNLYSTTIPDQPATKSNRNERVYPDKITFDEEAIQKLFGNEAAEDEDVVRLREYYFKNETFESITVDLPLRILVGHKGIGKSALFKVAFDEDIERNRIPIKLQPDDIAEIARDESDFLEIIRKWKMGISEIVYEKLCQFFSVEGKPLLKESTFSNVRTTLSELLIHAVESHTISDELVPIAKKLIEGAPINIYLDDLDRGWLGGRKDIVRLSALLNAVRDLTNVGQGYQFKIALRSDVYFLVRTSDESTDKIQGSVIWYSWTNHEILVMLIKRIETYLGRKVNETALLTSMQSHIAYYLEVIMEKRFRGYGKWENVPMYRILMSLIRKRPRDIVKLLTLAARIARKSSSKIILTEHFQAIFDEYSQDRLQDTINEYRTELPDIERLLLGMRPTGSFRNTVYSYIYTTSGLMQKLNNIMHQGAFRFSNGENADAKALAQFLYKINFLTARKVLPSGEIDRKYFEENRYLTSRFADFGYDWEVHMAYRWALQPLTTEDIFETILND